MSKCKGLAACFVICVLTAGCSLLTPASSGKSPTTSGGESASGQSATPSAAGKVDAKSIEKVAALILKHKLSEQEVTTLIDEMTSDITQEDNLTNNIRTVFVLRDTIHNIRKAMARVCGFDTSGMYVRIQTDPIQGADGPRHNDSLSTLQRLLGLFSKKNEARNLTIRFQTTNPSQKFTKSLLTLHSNQSGRDISRDVVDRGHISPFFRVSPDTSMTLSAEYTRATDVTLKAVQASLRVARVAAAALVPGSGLLTTLTQDKVNQEARIFDTALGEIFSSRISETRQTDFTANDWKYVRAIRVRLYGKENEDAKNYVLAAYWDVAVSNPRPSMFSLESVTDKEMTSQINDCITQNDPAKRAEAVRKAHMDAVRRAFSYVRDAPDKVLRFYVGDNTTVSDLIRGRNWYPSLIEQLAQLDVRTGGKIDPAKLSRSAPLATLCTNVPDALYGIGLNTYDATAGLWAVAQTTLASQNLLSLITNKDAPPACRTRTEMMKSMGLID